MFKPLQPDFNLKRLVTFIAALWLQVTALLVFCCISSPPISKPFNNIDTLHTMAMNGARSSGRCLRMAPPLSSPGIRKPTHLNHVPDVNLHTYGDNT
jgi:hypothetical protein